MVIFYVLPFFFLLSDIDFFFEFIVSLKIKDTKQEEESMGRVFKFHNDVDTDQIIASQYLLLPNIEEMKVYI